MSHIVIPLNSYSQTEITLEEYDMYFQAIRESGAYGVELRRELLSPQPPTLEWLRDNLERDLFIVYSAPLPLWLDDGRLNEDGLERVYEEAKTVKAKWIKLSLGNYNEEVSDLTRIKGFLESQSQQKIQLLVENDQTEVGGKIQRFKAFFKHAEQQGLSIKMTFDIGNWLYTEQDPIKAWEALASHVIYLHLKQVIQVAGTLETVPLSLDAQSIWIPFVKALPNKCVMALEFPISPLQKTKAFVEMVKELKGEFACNK
jgi:sugar phosphate isomerase/epimerase